MGEKEKEKGDHFLPFFHQREANRGKRGKKGLYSLAAGERWGKKLEKKKEKETRPIGTGSAKFPGGGKGKKKKKVKGGPSQASTCYFRNDLKGKKKTSSKATAISLKKKRGERFAEKKKGGNVAPARQGSPREGGKGWGKGRGGKKMGLSSFLPSRERTFSGKKKKKKEGGLGKGRGLRLCL